MWGYMGAHARLGPSYSASWMQCPLSIVLAEEQNIPPVPAGPPALAGTLLHDKFEALVWGKPLVWTDSDIKNLNDWGFSTRWGKSVLDQSVKALRKVLKKYRLHNLVTEQRVNAGLAFGRADFWGTADVIAWNDKSRVLAVLDLKTGRHGVDPEDNTQALSYALGVCVVMGFNWNKIIIGILQPSQAKDEPILWETDAETLLSFRDRAAEAAALTDLSSSQLSTNPSAKACQWCRARQAGICPDAIY